MQTQSKSYQSFIAVLAVLFASSTIATVILCRSMSNMGYMQMPGGWTMSGVWMLMPDQTWLGAAASFLLMWIIMMAAMMLPSLAPMLVQYREAVARDGEVRLGGLTAIVGAGYFFVWTVIGLAVFAIGFAVSDVEMQRPDLSRCVPVAIGIMVVVIGALQFSRLKARTLACCRNTPEAEMVLTASVAIAWRHGLKLGIRCASCCFGLMILVVIGVMDLRLMAILTVAVTAERLARNGVHVARGIGFVTMAAGLYLIAKAAAIC
jgi:predicted metal-binding membrane protein